VDAQDMNAMLQGVSEGEKQRLMMALEEMQMKEQVTICLCEREERAGTWQAAANLESKLTI
jgi:hypothetical protein